MLITLECWLGCFSPYIPGLLLILANHGTVRWDGMMNENRQVPLVVATPRTHSVLLAPPLSYRPQHAHPRRLDFIFGSCQPRSQELWTPTGCRQRSTLCVIVFAPGLHCMQHAGRFQRELVTVPNRNKDCRHEPQVTPHIAHVRSHAQISRTSCMIHYPLVSLASPAPSYYGIPGAIHAQR